MCGIAGFSLSEADQDVVNPKTLTKRLALSIESRGRDATGYAFRGVDEFDGEVMLLKHPMPASKFVSQGLHNSIQRGTNTALIHTRAATQGAVTDNDNNHPIIVDRRGTHPGIVGIHNGMLWNDKEVWDRHPDLKAEKKGLVDSQLIFQVLSRKGRDALAQIDGDAAIAWVDMDAPEALQLARMGGRPLAVTTTASGSVMFASTPDALLEALKHFPQLGSTAKADIVDLAPGEWLTVTAGEIIAAGTDFPVISLSRSYKSTTIGKPSKPAGVGSYWNRHPWDDDWDDYGPPSAVSGTKGELLPFAPMSATDKATYEASLLGLVDDEDDSDASPGSSADSDLTEFDVEFFHYVTGNVFVDANLDDQTILAYLDLIYSRGDEAIVDVWLDEFCKPTNPTEE